MLSLSRGRKIAEIVHKGSVPTPIYLYDGDDDDANDIECTKCDEALPKSFYTSLRGVSPSNMILLKRAIRLSQIELINHNTTLLNAYNQAQEMLKEIVRKNIDIPKSEGTIEIVPTKEWQGHMLISAPSGAGKSTFVGNYLKKYKKLFPKNKIYIVSPIRTDEAFEGLKPEYVKIDGSILQEPLDVSEFPNSIIVFDDIESIREKDLSNAVEHFRDSALMTARHENTMCLCITHILLNSVKSKVCLNECSRIVIFPKTNFSAISNYVRRYLGFSKDDLNWLKGVKSRAVVIFRNYPVCLVSEQQVKIL